MAEQRRYPRYGVHLAVRYTNAEQFVTDYVENLSAGGLFIAGAHKLQLLTNTRVEIELPGQGTWTVGAKSVFVIDETAAQQMGRQPGAGFEIYDKPPGFDDALLGYLLRLGRRREHAVMVGEVPGINLITDAGYRVLPLESEDEVAIALANGDAKIVAIIVPPALVTPYRNRLGERGKELVFAASGVGDIVDLLARIDSLL
ncbi:MAG TPA: PilZ domain-containing protein [Kofleriaceae bacterium]|nr:PilZ domain-containing protein [Kofleriaceae bacterium]